MNKNGKILFRRTNFRKKRCCNWLYKWTYWLWFGGLDRILNEGGSYEEWLEKVTKEQSKEYTESIGKVPANTYFTIRESDNKIIGMVNIRHYLNDYLRKFGGHIGYGIRPTERRKGYNKIQLYLTLLKAQKLGLDKVMLGC